MDDVVNLAQVNPSITSGLRISHKQVNTKQELDKAVQRLITEGWEEETNGKNRLDNLRSHINVCAISPSTDAGNGYFFSEYSPQDLRKEQERDPDLKVLIEWLNTGKSPSEADMLLCSPAAKNYWINKDMFGKDNNGIVVKTLFIDKSPIKVWIVPKTLRKEVMKCYHDLPSSGHQGVDRTLGRLKTQCYWYGIANEVKSYIFSCKECSTKKKTTRQGRFPLKTYHAGSPMEKVHIDFLGPLPKTGNGNEYILVMVDQFTKWVEIVPLPSQNAELTAKAAVDNFFSKFGYPLQVHSDQGRNFESRVFQSVCELLRIHKSRTTAYRPSANGQVEQYNRTLMDAVRCFIDKSQDKWDEYLQQLAGALRCSVNRHTGYTPNKMMLGREINQPADLMFRTPENTVETEEEFVTELQEAMVSAHETTRKTLQTAQMRMKRDYDVKVLQREFQVGDLVYVLDSATTKGVNKKLTAPWKGPAVVITKLTPYLYRIRDRKSETVVNHDRLKRCNDRNNLI